MSWRVNSSRYNPLFIRLLFTIVTSDEFLRKLLFCFIFWFLLTLIYHSPLQDMPFGLAICHVLLSNMLYIIRWNDTNWAVLMADVTLKSYCIGRLKFRFRLISVINSLPIITFCLVYFRLFFCRHCRLCQEVTTEISWKIYGWFFIQLVLLRERNVYLIWLFVKINI